jgi:alpha-mannosidase
VEPIWNYLQELETDEFPYNTCYLRYTVHGDNGPPDELMPDVIRAWNERYDSPQFRITTTKEFFTAFEEQYGEYLPTYGGDMTPTWEDGASSTARETAMNRESAARLTRTEILWSMLSPESDYPARELAEAWKNVLLFSEHTWGASASGPDPYSQFTKDLWAGKKMYADSADVQSRRLCDETMAGITAGEGYVQVLNTNLWPRTDVVTVAADLTGKRLLAPSGEPVAVQRLHDGGWIFLAEEVPALSSSVYRIVPAASSAKAKKSPAAPVSMIGGNVLDNGLVRVAVDPAKGTIRSLKAAGADYEYAAGEGLNDYIYSGRIAADPRGIDRVTRVEVLDDGPVAATLRIVSDAPGCNALWRDVTVYRGLGRVDIRNTVDKQDILEHESVRFVFPFNFAHPEITMDLAMSEMHPEREQLAGVNKHYYSLLNGMAVGDLEHAVCLTTLDAPFVELGTPSGEDYRLNPRHGYGWWPSAQISPVVYSWVMNNTWRTNYKASQGGVASFRYSLQICDPFDLKLKQRGAEREQPLIAVESGRPEPVGRLFRLEGRNRIAVSGIAPSADGTGYIVRLQNMGDQSVHSAFVWGRMKARRVSVCDYREQPLAPFDDRSFWMKPFEYLMLKVETE